MVLLFAAVLQDLACPTCRTDWPSSKTAASQRVQVVPAFQPESGCRHSCSVWTVLELSEALERQQRCPHQAEGGLYRHPLVQRHHHRRQHHHQPGPGGLESPAVPAMMLASVAALVLVWPSHGHSSDSNHRNARSGHECRRISSTYVSVREDHRRGARVHDTESPRAITTVITFGASRCGPTGVRGGWTLGAFGVLLAVLL